MVRVRVSLGAVFFCLLVCMRAAVTQPSRPDPLVKSQKIALCCKVALLHGQTTYNCLHPTSDTACQETTAETDTGQGL